MLLSVSSSSSLSPRSLVPCSLSLRPLVPLFPRPLVPLSPVFSSPVPRDNPFPMYYVQKTGGGGGGYIEPAAERLEAAAKS